MGRPGFPRSLKEFQARFGSEAACRAYLQACRWPEGYGCGRCAHREAFELPRRGLWQYKACGYQPAGTAGTVLHRTRQPLPRWFWAAYLVKTHAPGLSALQLQRQWGLESYETAWVLLHKLRRAMGRPHRDRLNGPVEVDEASIAGPEGRLKGGRQRANTVLVVGAVEVRGRASGRARLQVVPDASAPGLVGFVVANVEPGAVVVTDGWGVYAPQHGRGDRPRPKTHGDRARAATTLPCVPRVFGDRQTRLRGAHHGVGADHLQGCLDEFTVRVNPRRTPMAAFQTLLGLATAHAPTTDQMLHGSESTR